MGNYTLKWFMKSVIQAFNLALYYARATSQVPKVDSRVTTSVLLTLQTDVRAWVSYIKRHSLRLITAINSRYPIGLG